MTSRDAGVAGRIVRKAGGRGVRLPFTVDGLPEFLRCQQCGEPRAGTLVASLASTPHLYVCKSAHTCTHCRAPSAGRPSPAVVWGEPVSPPPASLLGKPTPPFGLLTAFISGCTSCSPTWCIRPVVPYSPVPPGPGAKQAGPVTSGVRLLDRCSVNLAGGGGPEAGPLSEGQPSKSLLGTPESCCVSGDP